MAYLDEDAWAGSVRSFVTIAIATAALASQALSAQLPYADGWQQDEKPGLAQGGDDPGYAAQVFMAPSVARTAFISDSEYVGTLQGDDDPGYAPPVFVVYRAPVVFSEDGGFAPPAASASAPGGAPVLLPAGLPRVVRQSSDAEWVPTPLAVVEESVWTVVVPSTAIQSVRPFLEADDYQPPPYDGDDWGVAVPRPALAAPVAIVDDADYVGTLQADDEPGYVPVPTPSIRVVVPILDDDVIASLPAVVVSEDLWLPPIPAPLSRVPQPIAEDPVLPVLAAAVPASAAGGAPLLLPAGSARVVRVAVDPEWVPPLIALVDDGSDWNVVVVPIAARIIVASQADDAWTSPAPVMVEEIGWVPPTPRFEVAPRLALDDSDWVPAAATLSMDGGSNWSVPVIAPATRAVTAFSDQDVLPVPPVVVPASALGGVPILLPPSGPRVVRQLADVDWVPVQPVSADDAATLSAADAPMVVSAFLYDDQYVPAIAPTLGTDEGEYLPRVLVSARSVLAMIADDAIGAIATTRVLAASPTRVSSGSASRSVSSSSAHTSVASSTTHTSTRNP